MCLDANFKFVVDPAKSVCIMRTSLVEASDEKGQFLAQFNLQIEAKIDLKKSLTFWEENVKYAPLQRMAETAFGS